MGPGNVSMATLILLLAATWAAVTGEDSPGNADQPSRIALPTEGLGGSTGPRKDPVASTAKPERAKEELKERGPLEPKPVNKLQQAILNYLQPTPLVDGLREEDKYGNDGERFNRIGRTFVDGVGALTSLLRSAVDYPMAVLKSISRRLTQALNSVGSRIVGLQ